MITKMWTLLLSISLGVMIACGGSSGSTSSTHTSPPPTTLSITSLSNISPLPLTPVQISTSGLDVSSAVIVKIQDGSGYSVTEPAIRVASDGTVTAAVPLYVANETKTVGPGTVSVVLQQGGSTSNAMSLNIQDLPPVSAYNVQPGQISHAMFQMQATLIGRRLNEFQGIQSATGNSVNTSQAQADLSRLLNATIQARSDIDRVTLDNTVVIPGGTLQDGNAIQFDQTTLDLMDRVQAVFLSGPFGALVTQSTPAVQAKKQYARLRRHSSRPSLLTSNKYRVEEQWKPALTHGPRLHTSKSRKDAHTEISGIQDLNDLLVTMEGINNIKDITESAQGLQNSQSLVDAVKALGTGAGVVNSLLADSTNFGMVAAVMSTIDVTTHCWGDFGAWIIAEAAGNQGAASLAVQDMAGIPLSSELLALQNLALAPLRMLTATLALTVLAIPRPTPIIRHSYRS